MLHSTVSTTRTEVVAEQGVVVAGHEMEAKAGVHILEQGGNAVDAGIAAAFVSAVVEPWNNGLGGHGRGAFYIASEGTITVVDWAGPAPRKVRPDMYELMEATEGLFGWRRVKDDANLIGYLSTPVPAAVAGYCRAHELLGILPLKEVIRPAMELAENGFEVDGRATLIIASQMEHLRRFPATAALFLKDGLPPRPGTFYTPGDRLAFPDMARTLQRIVEEGPDVMYRGEIAHRIAEHIAEHNGLLTLEDLAEYHPGVSAGEIHTKRLNTYRGYEYVTCGSAVMVETLNILECFDLASLGPDSPTYRHLVIEAMRRAWTDALYWLGDPKFVDSPWMGITSKEYGRQRAGEIDLGRATAHVEPSDPWLFEGRPRPSSAAAVPSAPRPGGEGHTTQMAVIDRWGNAVSIVTSLGRSFGSKVSIPGTGILISNLLESFDPEPGHLNSIAPGKRPVHAGPRVIVFKDGHPLAAICASGGRRTATGVLHVMLNLIDFGMGVQEAIEAQRLHCEVGEVFIDSNIPQGVQDALKAMGHPLVAVEETVAQCNFGRVVAVRRDPQTGRIHGGADPLRSAGVAGF